MGTRTTISLETDLHERLRGLLKDSSRRLNPLINDLLKQWANEQERERYRDEIRKRFDAAFADGPDYETADLLEKEWEEVDEESARNLENA